MAIVCPKCSRRYEGLNLQTDNDFYCDCGQKLLLEHEEIFSQLENICKEYMQQIEEEKVVQIRKASDRVVSLIIDRSYSKIDVEIEQNKLKELIENIAPDKIHLYSLIYEPRFNRLWEQFREDTST